MGATVKNGSESLVYQVGAEGMLSQYNAGHIS